MSAVETADLDSSSSEEGECNESDSGDLEERRGLLRRELRDLESSPGYISPIKRKQELDRTYAASPLAKKPKAEEGSSEAGELEASPSCPTFAQECPTMEDHSLSLNGSSEGSSNCPIRNSKSPPEPNPIENGAPEAPNGKIPSGSNEEEDGESDSDSELGDDEEVDAHKLLDEQLGDQSAKEREPRIQPEYKSKIVLSNRNPEYFEVLPDGWIEITHQSGMPVYLHKGTRVCTFSRPYFLGPGSARHHEVPLAAIPCLREKRAQEAKEGGDTDLSVRVESGQDFKDRNLTPTDLNTYCQKGFQFKTIQIKRFKKWSENRSFHKNRRQTAAKIQQLGRPTLPSNVQLITVPSLQSGSKPCGKQFFVNPRGKTSVAILHEYVQKILKGKLNYEFTETRNTAKPYSATVRLESYKSGTEQVEQVLAKFSKTPAKDGGNLPKEEWVAMGTGLGSSKKLARLDAAKAALQILVPGIHFGEDMTAESQTDAAEETALFDLLPIKDARIPELCAKAAQPSPFTVLQKSLSLNSHIGDTKIKTDIQRVAHQQHVFWMSVGKHRVEVSCTNKKDGKQKASQHMIEKIHPDIKTWGSLIRLHGYDAHRRMHEPRREKESVIKLQAQGDPSAAQPNLAILEKLRLQMRTALNPPPDQTAPSSSIAKIDI